jgi:hypothetical protein
LYGPEIRVVKELGTKIQGARLHNGANLGLHTRFNRRHQIKWRKNLKIESLSQGRRGADNGSLSSHEPFDSMMYAYGQVP